MKLKNKLILAYGILHSGMFLQSCSYTGIKKYSVTPITNEELLNKSGTLTKELSNKIQRLEKKGFIGGKDTRGNNDIKKHLMFVLHHSLIFRHSKMPLDTRVDEFKKIIKSSSGKGLVWNPVLVHIDPDWDPNKMQIQFKLNTGIEEEEDNRESMENNKAPKMVYNSKSEQVQVDHLFRDDTVTIELPASLHRDKTQYIDNLINLSEKPPTRKFTRNYWVNR